MAQPTDTLADIGADHAWLLTALACAGKIRRGIGVEIAQGPFDTACRHIAEQGLSEQVQMRLGDGLQPLAQGEATACVIAGMGGKTIRTILQDSPAIAKGMDYLLLQPMTGEDGLRLYLQENGWRLSRETLVQERGIIYQIMVAVRGYMAPLGEAEAAFGPLLLATGHQLLPALVEARVQEIQRIIDGLGRSETPEAREKETRLRERAREWEGLA